jgi:hypothetical protein
MVEEKPLGVHTMAGSLQGRNELLAAPEEAIGLIPSRCQGKIVDKEELCELFAKVGVLLNDINSRKETLGLSAQTHSDQNITPYKT